MSIADEIRAVLQEVGSLVVVHKPDGTETNTDYIDDNSHSEHTNPNIRAFFYDLNLHYPTDVQPGDTVRWGTDPYTTEILITAMSPQMFENEIVEFIASGYVVNDVGGFWFYNQDADPGDDYDENPAWAELYPALQIRTTVMDRLYRSMIRPAGNDSMDVADLSLQMFISSYFSKVAMGMQWRSVTGQKYKVDHIEENNFPGLRVVFLSEETRA